MPFVNIVKMQFWAWWIIFLKCFHCLVVVWEVLKAPLHKIKKRLKYIFDKWHLCFHTLEKHQAFWWAQTHLQRNWLHIFWQTASVHLTFADYISFLLFRGKRETKRESARVQKAIINLTVSLQSVTWKTFSFEGYRIHPEKILRGQTCVTSRCWGGCVFSPKHSKSSHPCLPYQAPSFDLS